MLNGRVEVGDEPKFVYTRSRSRSKILRLLNTGPNTINEFRTI
jgi:predicted transcriptional regulator